MTVIHGFELLEDRQIGELNTRARFFRHKKTGAELLSLENSDENKVFGITFRTPPPDSSGAPHIMEHAVLCGSRKYPLKEPFVELVKGSLNTFLNAFTFPDKTSYPVASQNLQDFYNLIDVYMDAVLHPLIPPHTLQQEGWHFELESLDAPLAYKGVVFNEMKGVYSSPDSIMHRYSQQALFPDNAYGLDSGGDPHEIPHLTYEQFKRFHKTYYHPSNARLFFYGDDDPQERLRLMNAYLKEYRRIRLQSNVSLQPRFDRPRRITIPYDAGEEAAEKKGLLTVNWLLPESGDAEQNLALHILEHLLIGTPASPLRKALIDSGLGEDLAGGGLESELRQMYFSTGLKGIDLENDSQVESLIEETLTRLAQDGLEPEMLASSLNTIEFRLRENNTGSYPRGLMLMLRSLATWLYGGDPIAPLAFEAPLSAIKGRLDAGERFFEDLIREYFLANPHRMTVILEPDPNLRLLEDSAEKERLARVRESMSAQELQAVLENTHLLKQRQVTPDTPEALATIPSLALEDLDRENKLIPLQVLECAGSRLLYHDLFTNGIAYLDLGFDLHGLPAEYLPYITLFGRALVEMGTEKEDFVRLSQRIGSRTGGIRPAVFTSALLDGGPAAAWLFLRGKATVEKTADLLEILGDVLLRPRLEDQERFRQMVLEEKADLEAGLIPGGHRMVNTRLRASFDEASWAAEKIGGVSYLLFLRQLAQAVDQDWPSVLKVLESIRSLLLDRSRMLCNVTLDAGHWSAFLPQLEGFLAGLPSPGGAAVAWEMDNLPEREGLTIPAQVNYVGKGAGLYTLGYRLDGSIFPILNYLRNTWLWERVRLQGGAYGVYSVFDQRSGGFTYISYRDPNLLKTLENYDAVGSYLRKLAISREELVKSIIGAIGDMDAYQLPDAKGYTSMLRYLTGESVEFRQRLREEILGAAPADFRAFGETLEQVSQVGKVVVIGSQQAIQDANQAHGGDWLAVSRVL